MIIDRDTYKKLASSDFGERFFCMIDQFHYIEANAFSDKEGEGYIAIEAKFNEGYYCQSDINSVLNDPDEKDEIIFHRFNDKEELRVYLLGSVTHLLQRADLSEV